MTDFENRTLEKQTKKKKKKKQENVSKKWDEHPVPKRRKDCLMPSHGYPIPPFVDRPMQMRTLKSHACEPARVLSHHIIPLEGSLLFLDLSHYILPMFNVSNYTVWYADYNVGSMAPVSDCSPKSR